MVDQLLSSVLDLVVSVQEVDMALNDLIWVLITVESIIAKHRQRGEGIAHSPQSSS